MLGTRYIKSSVADPDPLVLGLLDMNQDPIVRGMDPADLVPSIIKQK